MLVVVGGHSRNIGKTSVVAGLIAALPQARWSAVKITQHGHGICSAAGEPCDCAIEYDHPFALSQERAPTGTDSGRFLAAGAERAYWLRTPVGQLGHAMPELRRILDSSTNAILESNSVLNYLRPDLYLAVLDFSVPDLKDSSRRFMDRADAFVVVQSEAAAPSWPGVPARWLLRKPRFDVRPPNYVSPELARFVGQAAGKAASTQVPRAGSE
jgi:hypothetical protein